MDLSPEGAEVPQISFLFWFLATCNANEFTFMHVDSVLSAVIKFTVYVE
jgi:hypothetical protein